MKIYLNLFIVLLLTNCNNDNSLAKDLSLLPFNGNVKTIQNINYKGEIKFGEPSKTIVDYRYRNIFHFSKKWVESETNIDLGFRLDRNYKYKFGTKGNCIENYDHDYNLNKFNLDSRFIYNNEKHSESEYYFEEDNGKLSFKLVIEYDKHDNLTKFSERNNQNITISELSVKNHYEKGLLIESKKLDSTGNLLNSIKYKYHTDSNKKSELLYWSSFSFEKETEQTLFDLNGNIVEFNSFDNNKKLIGKTKYEYDANNNMIKKVKYDKNGDLALKINYEFNSKNQVIHKTEFDESNEEKQEIYDYNTNGFVSEVKVIEYDYRGREETTIFTFDYKIDSYKNWTIQNTYENNELVLISERKIDYY